MFLLFLFVFIVAAGAFFQPQNVQKALKTIKNHRKAVKTGSKPGARGARGTPRGRPGLKVPGNPPLKSPALGL